MTSAGLHTIHESPRSLRRLVLQCLGALALVLGCSLPAQADRVLPPGMMLAFVDYAQFPMITLKRPRPSLLKQILTLGLYRKNITYPVAASVRIRDEDNHFLVNGMMPLLKGKVVAVKPGIDKQINQIWVLTEAEANEYATRPGTLFPPIN